MSVQAATVQARKEKTAVYVNGKSNTMRLTVHNTHVISGLLTVCTLPPNKYLTAQLQ